jgi:hypothetical protein
MIFTNKGEFNLTTDDNSVEGNKVTATFKVRDPQKQFDDIQEVKGVNLEYVRDDDGSAQWNGFFNPDKSTTSAGSQNKTRARKSS